MATGVGVVVGNHARLGGWALDAAMAESPAEEAGLRRGERILAVGATLWPSVFYVFLLTSLGTLAT